MLNRWGKDDKTVLEEGITAIAQETESMKGLVESLLFLARHDKKTLLMEWSPLIPARLSAKCTGKPPWFPPIIPFCSNRWSIAGLKRIKGWSSR